MPRFFYAVFFAFLPWPAAILFCFSSSSFSSLHRGCCPAWAAGRLPGAGHGVRGVSYPLSGCNAARALRKKRGFSLCLGADVCSRSRQSVSFFKGNTLPPAPPYSPFAATRRVSFLLDCTPAAACRMGHRRGPSPACGRGDVRACCGAPSALRASGIAFAPAPSLHQR